MPVGPRASTVRKNGPAPAASEPRPAAAVLRRHRTEIARGTVDDGDLLPVVENDPAWIARHALAADEHAELLRVATAVTADAEGRQANAPLVEELAECVGPGPVGLDVDDPARAVRVQR